MKDKKLHTGLLRLFIFIMVCVLSAPGILAADKYVVVIDAGHGGKDHGAIDNNAREKDINLAVALKLGEYIKKHGKNIKVVYTRDKDEYLTLQQRADKANKAKGDLFISIHTNSVDKNNPNRAKVEGTSTYTLGLHKNDDNMNVARRENNVMTLEPNYQTTYSGFNPQSDESYIIFEMAQKANMSHSVKFAEQVQKQLTKQAGRKDRGVHQAGFWVLWATSMPAVLVELDFICNPVSAKYLTSSEGVDQLAKGLGTATIAYFKALEQHDKNRLRTEKKSEDDDFMMFGNDQEGVVLASTTEEVEKIAPPQVTPAERTRKPANRRRRSDASREKSERQEYAEAVIKNTNMYVVDSATPSSQTVTTAAATPAASSKNNNQKNGTTNVKQPADKGAKQSVEPATKSAKQSAKPTQEVASNEIKPDKQTASAKSNDKKQIKGKAPLAPDVRSTDKTAKSESADKSPARLSKVTTVYKIQLLSSTERLKAGNPIFQGLNPVTCIPDGDEYKYVYGESTNRNEIYHLLSDVQKKIPDAQVIKVKKAM